ncbi:MAG: prepilin-type N-terminal cleavage/methylation domain-containing protein [Patescibacteria group bacterium]|nr:prepilin-type N-terminal cleavage/methylation domain-containing protein [Patescibacteria group bacterium]
MRLDHPFPRRRTQGFSLIELLVALVFISFLMAGMLRIYGSAIQGFATANETIKAQRDNRWAMDTVQDDLQSAGYFYPVRPVISTVDNVDSSAQNPVLILPGQTMTNKFIADPNNPAATPTNETITYDELDYLTDQVLPLTATLSATPTDSTHISVTATYGDLSLIHTGDFALILDAPYPGNVMDIVVIGGGPYSGSSGTLSLNVSQLQDPNTGAFLGAYGSLRSLYHQPGTTVVFIRPYQVVRYALLPMALDPANPLATVPCLVRDQANYPSDGSRIAWPAATADSSALTAAGVTRTVAAENVIGLRFDMSANLGQSWVRAADWPTTQANLNAQLASLAAANPGVGYVSTTQDPSHRLWYRYAPVLFRVDLTTRTVVRRAEYNTATSSTPTLAYRTRTQTLFVQPRNFGFGL